MTGSVCYASNAVVALYMWIVQRLSGTRATSLIFIIVPLSVLLAACQSEQDSGLQSASPDQSADWLPLLAQESLDFPAPGPLNFPEDLGSHPDAAAESLVLEAFLFTTMGRAISVQVQIDRAALKQSTSVQSDWAYTDVMRSSLIIAMQDVNELNHRESISRLALGMSGSNVNRLFVGDTRIDIAYENSCNAQFGFSGTANDGLALSLTWYLPECPRKQSLGQFNQWSAAAVEVNGQIMLSGSEQELEGRGWMRNRFGNLPTPGGAVLIDEASLFLDDQLLLDLSRSRRRSGRGPQTVAGTLGTTAQGESSRSITENLEMQWIDEGESISANTGSLYPKQIRILSSNQEMGLILTPLIELPEVTDRLGVRWNGAVRVSGSHTGYGFVNMAPLVGTESR